MYDSLKGALPTQNGKYAGIGGKWVEVHSFNDRKNPEERELTKVVVTKGGSTIIFNGITSLLRIGPVGNEATLYTEIAEKVPPEVYSTLKNYTDVTPIVKNGQFDSCRNAAELYTYLAQPGSYGIVSGRKPSGPCHFGHKLVTETLAFFQRNGAEIFMPLADSEAGLDSKLRDESQYRYFIADNLLDWGSSGLDLDAAHVYLQSEEMRVMNIGYAAARQLDLGLAVDVYGRDTIADELSFLFASLAQVGDILLPQHPDFGKKHSLMLSGPDQDGNMLMTMSLAQRMLDSNFSKFAKTVPSSLYVKSISNLEGKKESASEPETTIYLGPSRNVYTKTSHGKILEGIDRLPLKQRIKEVHEKIDRFSAMDRQKVIDAISRRQDVFKEFDGEKELGIDRFKELVGEIIVQQAERRRAVYEYAVWKTVREYSRDSQRAGQAKVIEAQARRLIPEFNSRAVVERPAFWNTPATAWIPEDKRQVSTRWYHMVAEMSDQLML